MPSMDGKFRNRHECRNCELINENIFECTKKRTNFQAAKNYNPSIERQIRFTQKITMIYYTTINGQQQKDITKSEEKNPETNNNRFGYRVLRFRIGVAFGPLTIQSIGFQNEFKRRSKTIRYRNISNKMCVHQVWVPSHFWPHKWITGQKFWTWIRIFMDIFYFLYTSSFFEVFFFSSNFFVLNKT